MNEIKEPLKGRTSGILIKMTEAVGQLDDVVVIGYGTQKRGNLTGAIASVSGKVLEKVPTAQWLKPWSETSGCTDYFRRRFAGCRIKDSCSWWRIYYAG